MRIILCTRTHQCVLHNATLSSFFFLSTFGISTVYNNTMNNRCNSLNLACFFYNKIIADKVVGLVMFKHWIHFIVTVHFYCLEKIKRIRTVIVQCDYVNLHWLFSSSARCLYSYYRPVNNKAQKYSLKISMLRWEGIKKQRTFLEYQVRWCCETCVLLHTSLPLEQRASLQRYIGPVNNVATQIPSWFFFFFSCYSPSRDDRLAGCWRSSEQCLPVPWSPGDGQATSPSALAAPGHSRDKPTGVPRRCLHGDEATGWPRLRLTPLWSATRRLWGVLPAQQQLHTSCDRPPPSSHPEKPFTLSFLLSSLKPVRAQRGQQNHPSLPWQCYPLWGLLGTVVRC